MKAVMLMFDTLTRNHLAPYGGDAITPNFTRWRRSRHNSINSMWGVCPACQPAGSYIPDVIISCTAVGADGTL